MASKRRSAVSTKPKNKPPSLLKQISFKIKTYGCGALKITDQTSLAEQMTKYVIAESHYAKAKKPNQLKWAAKMAKAKDKWITIMKCMIDRINKDKEKKIPYNDHTLESNFEQKRAASARKILKKAKLQLKF